MSIELNEKKAQDDEDDSEENDDDYIPKGFDDSKKNEKSFETRNKIYKVDTSSDTIEPIEKNKSDDVWSEFVKDINVEKIKKSPDIQENSTKNLSILSQAKSNDSAIKKDFNRELAFKKKNSRIEVSTKSENGKTYGTDRLSSILARINKEPKISTLQKSLQDWDEFKKKEEIEEELEQQNKSKNSYLERKAFLERADAREHEVEKEIRNSKRLKKNF